MHKLGKIGCVGFVCGIALQLALAAFVFTAHKSSDGGDDATDIEIQDAQRNCILLKLIPISLAGLGFCIALGWKCCNNSIFEASSALNVILVIHGFNQYNRHFNRYFGDLSS